MITRLLTNIQNTYIIHLHLPTFFYSQDYLTSPFYMEPLAQDLSNHEGELNSNDFMTKPATVIKDSGSPTATSRGHHIII